MTAPLAILRFSRGRKGDVVARLPSGKIAFVNRNARTRPSPGEWWVCRIDMEKDRFSVITPISQEITVIEEYEDGCRTEKQETAEKFSGRASELQLQGGRVIVHKKYPAFLSPCRRAEEEKKAEEAREIKERELDRKFQEIKDKIFQDAKIIKVAYTDVKIRYQKTGILWKVPDKSIEWATKVTVSEVPWSVVPLTSIESEAWRRVAGDVDLEDLYYSDQFDQFLQKYKEMIHAFREIVEEYRRGGYVPVVFEKVQEEQKYRAPEELELLFGVDGQKLPLLALVRYYPK